MQVIERDNLAHLILDRAADETLVFDWSNDAGQPIDLSDLIVRFVVKGVPALTFEPAIDADDSKKRVLVFDQSYTAQLSTKPRECMVEAEYEDGAIDVIFRGTIAASGWSE